MKCPNCGVEIIDYKGRCFECSFYGSSNGSTYCKNRKRLKELNIDNVFYDPIYDGGACEYFKDENERYKEWKLYKNLANSCRMMKKVITLYIQEEVEKIRRKDDE